MSTPNTLQDLVTLNQADGRDVEAIAASFFDGLGQYAHIDGYIVTVPLFSDLPLHVQGFIAKAILASSVENILGTKDVRTELERRADEEAEAPRQSLDDRLIVPEEEEEDEDEDMPF